MPAKDLGTKHVCFKCSTKFYDLKKPDPICPKCGADQREATASRPTERKSRLSAVPKIIAPVEPAELPADEEEAEEIEEDAEELADEEEV
ncbi:MAG: TIGR02300 family protein [Myxococcota bacterium]